MDERSKNPLEPPRPWQSDPTVLRILRNAGYLPRKTGETDRVN